MKLLSAPRQPFVGLAVMAALGIIAAEILPLPPIALTITAIILALCILIGMCWPRPVATYAIVGAGFFLVHNFATQKTQGQQLADELGSRSRVVTAIGSVITEPKIASSGFATFLLKLKSIEFEDRKNPQVRSGRSVGKARLSSAMNSSFLELPSRYRRRGIPANSICALTSRGATFVECYLFAIRRRAR